MWPAGANVLAFNMLNDTAQAGTPPAAVDGDAWVVSNWGGTPADGHIAVYKDRSWYDLGELVRGDIIVVKGGGTGSPGGSFAGLSGHMLRYNGVTWDPYCSNTAVQVVVSIKDSLYKGQIWACNGNHSWYRVDAFPVSGADNNFMALDENGMPQDSGEAASSFAASAHAAEHLATGGDALEHWVSEFIPVTAMVDGNTAPASAEVLVQVGGTPTGRVTIRKFDSGTPEMLVAAWEVPYQFSSGVYYRVVGWISESTAPTANEGVAFTLEGFGVASGESLQGVWGTAVKSAIADLDGEGCTAQLDRFFTPISTAVTITGIAAGETAALKLTRATGEAEDDYAQDVGVSGVVLYYKVSTMDDPNPA